MSTEARPTARRGVRGDFGDGHRNAIAAAFLALEVVPGGKDIPRPRWQSPLRCWRRSGLIQSLRDAAQAGLIR